MLLAHVLHARNVVSLRAVLTAFRVAATGVLRWKRTHHQSPSSHTHAATHHLPVGTDVPPLPSSDLSLGSLMHLLYHAAGPFRALVDTDFPDASLFPPLLLSYSYVHCKERVKVIERKVYQMERQETRRDARRIRKQSGGAGAGAGAGVGAGVMDDFSSDEDDDDEYDDIEVADDDPQYFTLPDTSGKSGKSKIPKSHPLYSMLLQTASSLVSRPLPPNTSAWTSSPHPFLCDPAHAALSYSPGLKATVHPYAEPLTSPPSADAPSASTPLPMPPAPHSLTPTPPFSLPMLRPYPLAADALTSHTLYTSHSHPSTLPVVAHDLLNCTLHIPRPPQTPLLPTMLAPPPPQPSLSYAIASVAATESRDDDQSKADSTSKADDKPKEPASPLDIPPPCSTALPPTRARPPFSPLVISHCTSSTVTATWAAATVLLDRVFDCHIELGCCQAVTITNCAK
jgi:hypothetical protein